MAKWAGKIGFAVLKETAPSVWTEQIQERPYFGDLLRVTRRFENSGNLNDNISISNDISIVADLFANNNFESIRYATYGGTKWKVASVQVAAPRLTLSLGGVYND